MHLVYVPDNYSKGTMYEHPTYAKAKYFAFKHRAIGATFIGKKAISPDLFLDRVAINGRKYRKKGVKNG